MKKDIGVIDYSDIEPANRQEVLDDLETITDNRTSDIADLKKIKPYAKRFGVIREFNRHCSALGVKV